MANHDVKLICFDLNDTLIVNNSWQDLNLAMGVAREKDELLFNKYQKGIINYPEWVKIILQIYQERGRANRKNIEKVIFDYTYMPGARQAVKDLRGKGYEIAIITGAMDLLASQVARELGVGHFRAINEFVFDSGDELVAIKSKDSDHKAKADYLRELCQELGIGVSQCACVGDGANDLDLFKLTGKGVTFVDSKIKAQAWQIIDKLSDLNKIF